jgi:predicted peptidase
MNRLALLTVIISLSAIPAMGQNEIDGFAARTYQRRPRQTMPYRLFIPPGYKKSDEYPLVLWLHGAGGIGDDNLRQIIDDQVPGTRLWTKPENLSRHPAFVLVPQSSARWPQVHLSMVLGILDTVRSEFHIDPQRIYVIGQSIGGEAAWRLVTDNPRTFAAAIFVCSIAARPNRAASVATLPVWAFQGSEDKPGVSATRDMIKAIRKAGGNPRYTEYAGAGHEIWNRVFREPDLAEWLFAQHK